MGTKPPQEGPTVKAHVIVLLTMTVAILTGYSIDRVPAWVTAAFMFITIGACIYLADRLSDRI